MIYHEDVRTANPYKLDYLSSVEQLVQHRLKEAEAARQCQAKKIMENPEKARAEFAQMLGWPLTEEPRLPLTTETILLSEKNGIRLYRIRFQIFLDFFFYGLYFEYTGQKLPSGIEST